MKRTCFGAIARIFPLRTFLRVLSAAGRGQPVAASVALMRSKGSLLADQRGAVAFEMLIVYSFMLFSLLLPAADLAIAGFQYISAWGALRGFGQYVQYNPPPDVTDLSTWTPGQQTTAVAGYTISKVTVLCGDTGAGATCTSANVQTSPAKYFSYTTTVPLAPLVLRAALCTSGNTDPCSFTLFYRERFQ
jgi:hypothetical protein